MQIDELSPSSKSNPHRGSHLPVLMKLFSLTSGPIAELGCGMYSTPYLHWACYPTRRPLTTFESQPAWFPFADQFQHDQHRIVHVADWNSTPLTQPWAIALVDHDNLDGRQRCEEVARLTHAEYVVCHDAENVSDHKYGYTRIHGLFRWRWKYTGTKRHTLLLSNVHDLTEFTIP